jgi:hypothetical protein
MKDCYYDLELHFILLDDYSQSYILKLRDRSWRAFAMFLYTLFASMLDSCDFLDRASRKSLSPHRSFPLAQTAKNSDPGF